MTGRKTQIKKKSGLSNWPELLSLKVWTTEDDAGRRRLAIQINELRHEKTCLRGLRPSKTRTGLLSFRSYLDLKNGFNRYMYYTI